MTANRRTYSPFGDTEADVAWDWRQGRVVGHPGTSAPTVLEKEGVVEVEIVSFAGVEPAPTEDGMEVSGAPLSDGMGETGEDALSDERSAAVEDLWAEDEDEWVPPARLQVDAPIGVMDAKGAEERNPAPLPRHEFDPAARALVGEVDVKTKSRRRLFRGYVNAALEVLGRKGAVARSFAEEILAACRNPKARIARIHSLIESGRTFDELVIAWQLKEAWRHDLDCGEIMGRYSGEPAINRAVDVPLGWEDAMRILDTFQSIPTLDELAAIITDLHEEWVDAWSEFFEALRGWQMPIDPPQRYFVQYLVERLHDQHRNLHALRGRE